MALWSFDVIIFTFSFVAWGASCGLFFGWFLTPMHPVRLADRGGTAPFCLGAAQLEAGDSCPVRF